MATHEVVRYVRRKIDDDFTEPLTYLGSEQRFVSSLINSSVNNLEEQYILGTDTYKETYIDNNGNLKIEMSYHINSDEHENLTDYYKVVTTIYKDYMKKSFYFDNKQIYLANKAEEVDPIDPTTFVTIQTDELYFVTNNGATETLILTKTTERKYKENGTREVIREKITNHIAS